MMEMINVELEQIEDIQNEVDKGVISVEDIKNRWVDFSFSIRYFSINIPLPTLPIKSDLSKKMQNWTIYLSMICLKQQLPQLLQLPPLQLPQQPQLLQLPPQQQLQRNLTIQDHPLFLVK